MSGYSDLIELTFEQGGDYYETITPTDSNGAAIDLSSYTFEMVVTDEPGNSTAWTNFTTGGYVNNALGTGSGQLRDSTDAEIHIHGSAAGVIHIWLRETTINAISNKTRGYFVLNVYDGTDRRRWLEGPVYYSEGTT